MTTVARGTDRALAAHRAQQESLKYTPTEFGWQDVWWHGERIGMVKRKGARWSAFTVSGMDAGVFGRRRAAGARLRRLVEGRAA